MFGDQVGPAQGDRIGDPRRVTEQLPDRDLAAIREPGQVSRYGIIDVDLPALGQLHHRHRGKRLGDRVGIEGGRFHDRLTGLEIGQAGTAPVQDLLGVEEIILEAGRVAGVDLAVEEVVDTFHVVWAAGFECTLFRGDRSSHFSPQIPPIAAQMATDS